MFIGMTGQIGVMKSKKKCPLRAVVENAAAGACALKPPHRR